MNDTVITVVGNLVDDVSLTFTGSGAAVANFTVAATPRTYDKAADEWKDGQTLYLRCSLWRAPAENLANCDGVGKGTRVVVVGRLRQRSYETRDGDKRTVIELEADEVAPSTKYATAKVTRVNGGNSGDRNSQSKNATASAPSHPEEPPF